MDMELFFLINNKYSEYKSLICLIVQYLRDMLDEQIKYEKQYDDTSDFIGCSLLCMYVESPFTSSKCGLEYILEGEPILEDYKIGTNASVYIDIYTGNFSEGKHILRGVIKKIENFLQTNIILLGQSSETLYVSSYNKNYVNTFFEM